MSRRSAEQRKKRRNFFGGCICLLIMIIAIAATNAMDAHQQAQIAALSRQTSQLEIRAKEALRQLEFAKTNDYVERIARNMGYIMPGEVLYVTGTSAANSSN